MKCSRCGRALTEDQAYNYQGKPICDDCLMDVGLSPHGCDPWAEYVDTADRKRHGKTGTAGLSQTETKMYEFVKAQGKATRTQVAAAIGLTEEELAEKLTPLLHSELIKEASEGNQQFLIVIG